MKTMTTKVKVLLGAVAGATFMFIAFVAILIAVWFSQPRSGVAPLSTPQILVTNSIAAVATASVSARPTAPITPTTFDAMSRVEIPSRPTLEFGNGPFTISLWFRTTTLYRPMTFAAKRVHTLSDGWVLHTLEDNSLLFYAAGCATAKAPAPNSRDGRWHHLAAVRRDDQLFLYLDGVAAGVGKITCTFADKHPIRIGMDAEPHGWHFAGDMAEVQFYQRAVEQAEITQQWNAGTPMRGRHLDGLVAGYHLGDGDEDFADFSGHDVEGRWVKE